MDREELTNEKISKKFVSQFDLVNHAITLADNMIRSGRSPRVKVDVDNPVIQILAEIDQGKDYLEEIVEKQKPEPEFEVEKFSSRVESSGKEKYKSFNSSKSGERRKARLIQG